MTDATTQHAADHEKHARRRDLLDSLVTRLAAATGRALMVEDRGAQHGRARYRIICGDGSLPLGGAFMRPVDAVTHARYALDAVGMVLERADRLADAIKVALDDEDFMRGDRAMEAAITAWFDTRATVDVDGFDS